MEIEIQMPVNKGKWEQNKNGTVTDGFASFLGALTLKTCAGNLPTQAAAENPEARAELAAAIATAFEGIAAPGIAGPYVGAALAETARRKVNEICDQIADGRIKLRRQRAVKRVAGPGAEWTGPVIELAAGEVQAAVDAGERALRESGRGLYQRGGEIVQVGVLPDPMMGTPRTVIVRLEKAALTEHLAASAHWLSLGRSGEPARVSPPAWIAETLLARRGRLTLPPLTAVVDGPPG